MLITVLCLFVEPLYSADGKTSTDRTPPMNPSAHVLIQYNRYNAPDSMIFDGLLARIYWFDETTFFGQGFEDWVYQEMNTTYSNQSGAWFMPRMESRRYTQTEIEEIADLLMETAQSWFETTINAQRDAFCGSETLPTMNQKLTVLENSIIEADANAEFFLNHTMEQLNQQSRADLRAWINRMKQGFTSTRYNPRTMWAEHEDMLDAKLISLCENARALE